MDYVVEEAMVERLAIYESNKGELAKDALLNTVGFDCGPGWVPLLSDFRVIIATDEWLNIIVI